jgi:nicotinamide mononucleotide transporter
VSRTSARLWLLLVALGATGTALIGTLLSQKTDAALPYIDAATTSTSLVAQWMMTRKLVENWIIWVAVDVVYIGMYIYKSLFVTAVLYLIFLILSAMGYVQWRRSLREREVASLHVAAA